MGKLTVAEAVELGAGIAETWKVLASLLTEAQETRAWKAAGFDRAADWLGDLPALPSMTLRVGAVSLAQPAAGQVVGQPAKAKRPRTASVSIPGRARDTSLNRREVTPMFKPEPGRRR